MKIELVEKTTASGEIYYYITMDGEKVIGSLSGNKTWAESRYKNIISNKGIDIERILESEEI